MRHAHARAAVMLIAAAAIAVGFAYAASARKTVLKTPQRVIDNVEAIRAELRASIESRGATEAYAALVRDAAGDDVPTRHGKAHVFGELLYAAEGKGGIAICDNAFTFGCYHGLISRTLATEGVAALPAIDAACVAASKGGDDTGCMHGVGHGLVEYYGAHDLVPPLEACMTLRPPSILGCTQGVFMEFATVTLDQPDLVPTSPDEPCASAPEAHRASCWFEQPYLLRRVMGREAADIARACTRLTGGERDACLLGFGRMATEYSDYDLATATSACALLDGADRLRCLGGSRWLFAVVGKSRPWPCDDLTGTDLAACTAAARAISPVE